MKDYIFEIGITLFVFICIGLMTYALVSHQIHESEIRIQCLNESSSEKECFDSCYNYSSDLSMKSCLDLIQQKRLLLSINNTK